MTLGHINNFNKINLLIIKQIINGRLIIWPTIFK